MTSSYSNRGDDRFFAAEAIGPRDEQQDASIVLSNPKLGTALLVVSDGVGGKSGGRIASQLVVKTVVQMWQDHRGELAEPLADLNRLCTLAHQQINAEGERAQLSPRATIVALYLTKQYAYWVHSGDSRLYHFRAGKLIKRTEDHSLLQVMLKQGLVKEEQMGAHPDQGLLIQALGGEQFREPAEDVIELGPADAFLLCTDGFWERTEISEMARLLFKNQDQAEAKLQEALKRAVKRNGPAGDNVTVAIALPASGSAGSVIPGPRSDRSAKSRPKILLIVVPIIAVFLGLTFFYNHSRLPSSGTLQPSPTNPVSSVTPTPAPNPSPSVSPTPSVSSTLSASPSLPASPRPSATANPSVNPTPGIQAEKSEVTDKT
jgi:PPM family protein phosphatase